jgi:hypothetical protein
VVAAIPPSLPSAMRPGTAGRPLSAHISATHAAVHEALDLAEAQPGYQAIARLSSHLAAMRRAVFLSTAGGLSAAAELRTACLSRARTAERALRLLERRLSGDMSAVGLPLTALTAWLTQCLDSYWPAERALVNWAETTLAAGDCDQLARDYGCALAHAPTRPHPRCPRSRLLYCLAFRLCSGWDRLLDTMDSRAGVGNGFPGPYQPGQAA